METTGLLPVHSKQPVWRDGEHCISRMGQCPLSQKGHSSCGSARSETECGPAHFSQSNTPLVRRSPGRQRECKHQVVQVAQVLASQVQNRATWTNFQGSGGPSGAGGPSGSGNGEVVEVAERGAVVVEASPVVGGGAVHLGGCAMEKKGLWAPRKMGGGSGGNGGLDPNLAEMRWSWREARKTSEGLVAGAGCVVPMTGPWRPVGEGGDLGMRDGGGEDGRGGLLDGEGQVGMA